ncbi:MAG TPA: tRNA (adenosine(37)-N6)-threonylcarbamoyltransferase complex dimerization subunit type 1 TsaB [Gemmatimonadales bacterium]|nr:tRNA (adenosine(37)-N6)-threonylcarbamoyltransferase complex dimerization subunit type 1 TsaB [Gemmatimonadales bacterium]
MWLALDTSGDAASVAVGLAGTSPRAEASLHGARQHAGALVPMIDKVLREAGVDGARGLTGVLLTDGPGSFTGLRVSASVAKAMVVTRGLQLRTAPSLLVLAAGALPRPAGPILAVLDALRGELYAAVYEFRDGTVTTHLAPMVAAPAALAAAVRPFGVKALAGNAPEPVLATLQQALGCARTAAPVAGANVLLTLLATGGALHSVTDPRGWEPEYGRPAEAQRKWEETHGRPLPPAPGHAR